MQGTGIVIHTTLFQEKDVVVKILDQSGNIVSGFVKSGNTQKNAPISQIGNIVHFTWVGREGSLGTIKLDCKKQYGIMFMREKIKFLCVTSICSILHLLLQKDTHTQTGFTEELMRFFELMEGSGVLAANILNEYMKIEALLLLQSGYFNVKTFNANNDTNLSFLTNILKQYNKRMPNERLLLEKIISG